MCYFQVLRVWGAAISNFLFWRELLYFQNTRMSLSAWTREIWSPNEADHMLISAHLMEKDRAIELSLECFPWNHSLCLLCSSPTGGLKTPTRAIAIREKRSYINCRPCWATPTRISQKMSAHGRIVYVLPFEAIHYLRTAPPMDAFRRPKYRRFVARWQVERTDRLVKREN